MYYTIYSNRFYSNYSLHPCQNRLSIDSEFYNIWFGGGGSGYHGRGGVGGGEMSEGMEVMITH